MAKISKRVVDAAKAGSKPVFLWDDRLAGFGLQVLPSGTKSFVFQYRTAEGRSRRATIAKVGSVTPDQARTLAEGMSQKVKDGGDPLTDKHAARDAITVADLLDQFTASPRYLDRASKPQANGLGTIERHLKPLLGNRHVERLEQDDIRRAFAAIRDGKTATTVKTGAPRGLARVTGGEGAARYACRLLRTAFGWAVEQRLIQRNPAAGINFGSDGEREAVLDADGYSRLFATLAKMETERRLRPAVADAVRIIAMTGARRGEISNLRWEHVDLKAGRIVLPPGRHKTGRKTGKPRIIALPAAAQAIVARQPSGGDFVFEPAKGMGPVALAKPWNAIQREAGLPKDFGLHGLRHSLATLLAVGGAQAAEIMTSLGHRQMSTTTRYLHFADTARAALAERAAAPALAAMAAAAGTPKAKVVALRKSRR